jgi:DNA repair exonuclease SbcCD ATPase subunit
MIGSANSTETGAADSSEWSDQVEKAPEPVAGTGAMVNVSQTFLQRSKWAARTLLLARKAGERICELERRDQVVRQGMGVAIRHMLQHNAALERSLAVRSELAANLARDTKASLEWKKTYDLSKQIVVHESVGGGTLASWVTLDEVTSAATKCETLGHQIDHDVKTLTEKVNEVAYDGRQLEAKHKALIADDRQASGSGRDASWKDIVEDVEAIVGKIQTDTDYVGSLDDTTQSAKTSRRVQEKHEREFFPPIESNLRELNGLIRGKLQEISSTKTELLKALKEISQIQYRASMLRPDLSQLAANINAAEEARVVVAKAVDMPYLYGVMLIELCRRNLWVAETKELAAETAESMATRKHDEEARRHKWHKHYGDIDVFRKIRGDAADIDVAFTPSRQTLPAISKADVVEYMATLDRLGLEQERSELQREFQGMVMSQAPPKSSGSSHDSPVGHGGISVFKNGSVIKTDQSEKIRSYESRIRRLEDLLIQYRYREMNGGPTPAARPPSVSGTSPTAGDGSMPDRTADMDPLRAQIVALEKQRERDAQEISSLSDKLKGLTALSERIRDREQETTNRLHDKSQQVSKLEADAMANRDKATKMESELAECKNKELELQEQVIKLTRQLEESETKRADAESLKKELLANLAAKESEYASFMSNQKHESEARVESLQDDVDTLEARVDELQDALETKAEIL